MDFIDEIETFTLIITDYKSSLIKEITDRKRLINYKVMTIKEFREEYYYKYDEEAIYSLMKEYNLKYSVAEILIKNMIYLTKDNYSNEKLSSLLEKKNFLIKNNLLKYNNLFKNYLKDKNIIVLSNNITKFDKTMFDEVSLYSNLVYKNTLNPIYEHCSYSFNSLEDEVDYVAYKINELINKGISIDKIKITNINNDYINTINRIFSFYNLRVNFNERMPIIGTNIVKIFLNNLKSSKTESLESIIDYKDTDIYKKIITVINKYTFIDDLLEVKELLVRDFKNTYIKQIKYENMIEVVDYNTYYFKDDEYVFMMNFNNTSIPVIYKDEDYITDSIKDELDVDKTVSLNIRSKQTTKDIIKSIKNLFITYKNKTFKETYYPSMLTQDFIPKLVSKESNISYSSKFDKLKLGKNLDELHKFGTKSEELSILNSNYVIPYKEYEHKYTMIDKDKLNKHLKGKLRLSYSSMNSYNECAFKYYLSNILKVDIFESSFNAFIGSVFHKVLEVGLLKEIDVREEVDKYIKDNNRVLTKKESFYINKLIEDLEFALNTIKNNMKYTTLDNFMLEKYIEVNKGNTLQVTFNGIIDKVISKEIGGICYMVLIDYKTYLAPITLDYIEEGLYMQLPVYLYLASNLEIENVKFGGFYLQQVLNGSLIKDESSLKLYGYSNMDESILSLVDNHYENSTLIKSMKLNNDGSFNRYAKVLSDEQIDNVISKTEEVIDRVIDNIENAKFDINPKIIGKDNIACKYCKFRDICFKDESDTVRIIKESDGEE